MSNELIRPIDAETARAIEEAAKTAGKIAADLSSQSDRNGKSLGAKRLARRLNEVLDRDLALALLNDMNADVDLLMRPFGCVPARQRPIADACGAKFWRKSVSREEHIFCPTVGYVRSRGMTSLAVYCDGKREGGYRCDHHATFDLSPYPDELPIAAIGRRFVCTACGAIGKVDARPNWSEARAPCAAPWPR